MSLVEQALQKVKQRNDAPPSSGPITEPTVPVQTSAQRRRHDPTKDRPKVELPSFPNFELDPALCAKNRIVMQQGERASHYLPFGPSAAYRLLRTRVLQRARTKGWNVLAVTSASPNDGKTLTTINLAMSIAREKNTRVFVLDLDMRNSSLCRCLGVRPSTEIIEFFEGRADAASLFFSVGPRNLVLAGGTSATDHSSELLASGRFEELLAYIRGIAPDAIVLIDLPPLLIMDDALVLAPRVDAIIVVASEGRTPRPDMTRVLEQLSGFPLAGFVLNRSRESLGGGDYDYGYGYGYGGAK